MANKQLKFIVVDDLPELRELVTFFLDAYFECETRTADSVKRAIEIIDSEGSPDLIITDLHMATGHGTKLIQHLEQTGSKVPIIVLSGEGSRNYPSLLTKKHIKWVDKPFSDEELIHPIKEFIHYQEQQITNDNNRIYIPVKLSLLKVIGTVHTPLFVKINNSKFIRVTQEESVFDEKLFQKYKDKGAEELFIDSSHSLEFISEFKKRAFSNDSWESANTDSAVELVSSYVDLMRQIGIRVGWKQEILKLAQANITRAIAVVQSQKSLNKLIEKFQQIQRFEFADHCTLTAYVATAIAHELGIATEDNLRILTFASIFHDVTLSDDQYKSKQKLIDQINKGESSANKAVTEVFNHSAKAASLVKNWDFCPKGVDVVIANHHELPNGTGFPVGRKSESIDLISAVFVVAEDYTHFLIKTGGIPEIPSYVKQSGHKWTQQPFKQALEALIKSSQHKNAA